MSHSSIVPWLIHVCDMTHTHVWHDSFISVTWLIHMCDMTHSSIVTWRQSFPLLYSFLRHTECFLCLFHFLQKSHMIIGSFAWNYLQVNAFYGSSPSFTLPRAGWTKMHRMPSISSLSTNDPLIAGLFCRKWHGHEKIRDPVRFRHPVGGF